MDAGSEQRQLASGTMLDAKYRIDSLLAVGGMGAVYVGTHTKLRKRVAIKVLNPQLSSPQMIERFHREAITASQVGHEGIAQVTDLGTSGDGEPFLVMELLEGESLGARLRSAGVMHVEAACELAASILAPLGAAHGAGIVHRDLKPDNVFLVRQSRGEMVKLLDFGISRATGLDAEFRLTTTGLVLGTPFYMSPEQAQGHSEITPASDLYSVGVILYEMLIGRVPILGENYNQLMYHVITGQFTPPRQLRPDLPPALEHVVLRAMALAPAQRPRSAAEFEHDLLPFCRPTFRAHAIDTGAMPRIGTQTPAPLRTPYGVSGAAGELATDPTLAAVAPATERSPAPAMSSAETRAPGRGKRWLGVLAALVVVAAAVAAVVLSRPGTAPAPVAGDPAPVAAAAAPVAAMPAPVAAAAAPAAPPPTAQPASAPARIKITLEIEPQDATVLLDGAELAARELEVARDAAPHRLQVSATGHLPEDVELRFDENQRLVFKLKPSSKRGSRGRDSTCRRADPAAPPTTRPLKPNRPDRIDSDSPYK